MSDAKGDRSRDRPRDDDRSGRGTVGGAATQAVGNALAELVKFQKDKPATVVDMFRSTVRADSMWPTNAGYGDMKPPDDEREYALLVERLAADLSHVSTIPELTRMHGADRAVSFGIDRVVGLHSVLHHISDGSTGIYSSREEKDTPRPALQFLDNVRNARVKDVIDLMEQAAGLAGLHGARRMEAAELFGAIVATDTHALGRVLHSPTFAWANLPLLRNVLFDASDPNSGFRETLFASPDSWRLGIAVTRLGFDKGNQLRDRMSPEAWRLAHELEPKLMESALLPAVEPRSTWQHLADRVGGLGRSLGLTASRAVPETFQ